MSFKFFRGDNEDTLLRLEPIQQLTLTRYNSQNVEFCFQFDEEEPVMFGNGPNDLHIHVSPTPNGNIVFNNNGKTFKIFARERINNG